MKAQVVGSIMVGLAVSAVLFLPLLVWQYRRYGPADALRMLWTSAGFIYAAAIVAVTVFPLPRLTPGYCRAHATTPLLDPLRFPRELIDLAQAKGAGALLTDWLVWEVALNFLLFVPFGLIVRCIFELPRSVVLIAAFGTSMLVEFTQVTGHWGMAPCPYRIADVTDWLTNTSGTIVGITLERITPRLRSTKTCLRERKVQTRPVTRTRRVPGMVVDLWYLPIAAIIGGTAGSTIYAFSHGGSRADVTPAELLELEQAIFLGSWIAATFTMLIPALVSTGASLGERTIYLQPHAIRGPRSKLLVRVPSVQGLGVTPNYLGLPWLFLALLWGIAALFSALITPRALSGLLSGCRTFDVRRASASPDAQDDTAAVDDVTNFTRHTSGSRS